MFNDTQPLPFSGNKYSVTHFGDILDIEGNIISVSKEEDGLFVVIDWIDGNTKYPVALLVLCAYFKLDLFPVEYYSRIKPLFIDGNKENNTPGNLIYSFIDGPIECSSFLGYYYIPMFTGYVINREGEVISLFRGKKINYSIQVDKSKNNRKAGYHNYHLRSPGGGQTNMSKHRLLCFTFKQYDHTVKSLTVNHIDTDTQNNSLDNLEWATYRENNLHAIKNNLRVKRSRGVLVRNLKTGEINRYSTISQCSQAMGHPHTGLVRHRLDSKHSLTRLYPDHFQYKYDDGKPWPDFDISEKRIARCSKASDIIARNVFIGDLIVFTGAVAGEELLKIDSRAIYRHLSDRSKIPIMGWNFQYLDEQEPWPIHTDRHLKVYKKHPLHPRHAMIVTDTETNEEMFFTSVKEGCDALNLPAGPVQSAILRNGCYGKFKIKYFKLLENLGQPTE